MHKGRRLEYFIVGWAVAVYLIGGFILTLRAPRVSHVFVWLVCAVFVFPLSVAGLLIGRWIRRNSSPVKSTVGAAQARPVEARLLLYMIALVVMIPADRVWAKATGWSLGHILLADLTILSFLIAITEIKERRKRRIAD
jgi:hypothetical protein